MGVRKLLNFSIFRFVDFETSMVQSHHHHLKLNGPLRNSLRYISMEIEFYESNSSRFVSYLSFPFLHAIILIASLKMPIRRRHSQRESRH
jgi:hypothetical protein